MQLLKSDILTNSINGRVYKKYSIDVVSPEVHPLLVMETFQNHLNFLAPINFLLFSKIKGEGFGLHPNEEYKCNIVGVWPCALKVNYVSAHGFKLSCTGPGSQDSIRFGLFWEEAKWVFSIEFLKKEKKDWRQGLYKKIPLVRFNEDDVWNKVCLKFQEKCKPSKFTEYSYIHLDRG